MGKGSGYHIKEENGEEYGCDEVLELFVYDKKELKILARIGKALSGIGILNQGPWITTRNKKFEYGTLAVFLPSDIRMKKTRFNKRVFQQYHS